MSWQPIETMPEDGREVLLWYGHINLQLPGYAGEFDRFIGVRPTHWMEVPKPPTGPAGDHGTVVGGDR
jgi:hypothetical protein